MEEPVPNRFSNNELIVARALAAFVGVQAILAGLRANKLLDETAFGKALTASREETIQLLADAGFGNQLQAFRMMAHIRPTIPA
jgi:hypothetical protein